MQQLEGRPLLEVAAGDPDPGNRQIFSEFLVWTSDSGLLSKRQAQETWNRYFNVKFVSLRGDYNNCAQTCPTRAIATPQPVEAKP